VTEWGGGAAFPSRPGSVAPGSRRARYSELITGCSTITQPMTNGRDADSEDAASGCSALSPPPFCRRCCNCGDGLHSSGSTALDLTSSGVSLWGYSFCVLSISRIPRYPRLQGGNWPICSVRPVQLRTTTIPGTAHGSCAVLYVSRSAEPLLSRRALM
jgi:hypothetical protein